VVSGPVLPDFTFEVGMKTIGADSASVEWTLHGTNTAPIKPGIEPTGKEVHLSGVDSFTGADGFTSARRYFDQKYLYE